MHRDKPDIMMDQLEKHKSCFLQDPPTSHHTSFLCLSVFMKGIMRQCMQHITKVVIPLFMSLKKAFWDTGILCSISERLGRVENIILKVIGSFRMNLESDMPLTWLFKGIITFVKLFSLVHYPDNCKFLGPIWTFWSLMVKKISQMAPNRHKRSQKVLNCPKVSQIVSIVSKLCKVKIQEGRNFKSNKIS